MSRKLQVIFRFALANLKVFSNIHRIRSSVLIKHGLGRGFGPVCT